MSGNVVLVCAPRRFVRLPLVNVEWLADVPLVMVDVCGRRRSPATMPGFRQGQKPGNAGKRERQGAKCSGKHRPFNTAFRSVLVQGAAVPHRRLMNTDSLYPDCACGCGNPVKTIGGKWLRGHNRRTAVLWVIDPSTGCWNWQTNIADTGYGRRGHNGGFVYAHRWMYEQIVGPIPEGLQIDHLCRNRRCVNPDHLEPVTIAENLRRGNGPSAINARKTHCIHGHPLSGENLYRDPRGRRQCRTCREAALARIRGVAA